MDKEGQKYMNFFTRRSVLKEILKGILEGEKILDGNLNSHNKIKYTNRGNYIDEFPKQHCAFLLVIIFFYLKKAIA